MSYPDKWELNRRINAKADRTTVYALKSEMLTMSNHIQELRKEINELKSIVSNKRASIRESLHALLNYI